MAHQISSSRINGGDHLPACFVCGFQSSKLWVEDYDILHLINHPYKVYRCKGCDLGFLCPQPTAEEITLLYGAGFYAQADSRNIISRFLEIGMTFFSKRRAALVESVFKCKGSVLDVGCGNGLFLEAMAQRDWTICGVDPSLHAKLAVKQNSKIEIIKGHLEDVPSRRNIDVITFWHSLEHASDPECLIREARKRLKARGGVIISVPNGVGIGKLFKLNWSFLDIPRHCYHFSPANLRQLLERNGFRIRKENYFLAEYSIAALLLSLINLVTTRRMYLYYLMKRKNMGNLRLNKIEHMYNFSVSCLALVIFLIPAILIALLAASINKGDCYTVIAIKNE